MPDEPMTAREKRWQAEEDARTLAQAEELKNDPKRIAAARNKAGEEADERQEQADALKKVAGRSTSSQPQEQEEPAPAPAPATPLGRDTANTGRVISGAAPPGPKLVTFFDNPPTRTPKK